MLWFVKFSPSSTFHSEILSARLGVVSVMSMIDFPRCESYVGGCIESDANYLENWVCYFSKDAVLEPDSRMVRATKPGLVNHC